MYLLRLTYSLTTGIDVDYSTIYMCRLLEDIVLDKALKYVRKPLEHLFTNFCYNIVPGPVVFQENKLESDKTILLLMLGNKLY